MKRGYDFVVIGGGVVGLWTALLAARSGRSVALVERAGAVGTMSSSRNSGVLHAGIYYAPGSAKAKHCVRGRHRTLAFLREAGVPFSLCGKYIVPAATPEGDEPTAVDEALAALENLRARAQTNGVEDARIIRSDQPFLCTEWALHVGCTGIVDLPLYMEALARAARESGVVVYLNHTCVAGEAGRVVLRNNDDTAGGERILTAPCIVNSAGLYADTVAALFGLTGFAVRPNKGSYFQLRCPLPVETLVYPLPAKHSTFLGVHYTPDTRGAAWVGPNSQWAESKTDFTPEGDRAAFFDGLSRIVRNGYTAEDLIGPSKTGIRSRLFENGVACTDFVIRQYPEGVCHLLGIESPGLTAAPSLAEEALGRLGVRG